MENKDSLELENLVRTYHGYIRSIVKKYVPNDHDAADVCQEVLLKIVMNLSSFQRDSKLSTWIYSVARNCAVDFLRKTKHEPLTLSDDAEGGVPQSGTSTELELGFMEAVMTVLTVPEREAYFLGEIFGLDSGKGGEVLGITGENFRQRVSRSRKKLTCFHKEHCGTFPGKNDLTCDFDADTEGNSAVLEHTKTVLTGIRSLRALSAGQIKALIPLKM